MGCPLNQVPWEKLQVGQKVISARGIPGDISDLEDLEPNCPHHLPDHLDCKHRCVQIRWEGIDRPSDALHWELGKVIFNEKVDFKLLDDPFLLVFQKVTTRQPV